MQKIKSAFHTQFYIEHQKDIDMAVEYMNNYLSSDGFELVKNKKNNKGPDYHLIKKESNNQNIITNTFADKLDVEFIHEQTTKCKKKIQDGDYEGAITNARTIVEEVFKAILNQVDVNVEFSKYKGDLHNMYKDVKKHLNLDPSKVKDIMKEVLTGLFSIVNGISGISNKMSDRHAKTYKTEKHHAVLAVDSAHVFCEFLISSQEYQKEKTKA